MWKISDYNIGDPIHKGPTEKCSLIDINTWLNKRYLKQYQFVWSCGVQPI